MAKHTLTCEKTLLDHLEANRGQWVHKVDLFSIAYEKGGYSPETTCPILRRLEREGKIKKGEYDGQYRKGLKQYCLGEPGQEKLAWHEILKEDGTRIMQQRSSE